MGDDAKSIAIDGRRLALWGGIVLGAGLLLVGLVLGTVVVGLKMFAPKPAAAPGRAPVASFDAVFAANPDRVTARRDAGDASSLFTALADLVEADGASGAARLRTAGDVEDLRVVLRSVFLGGFMFGDHYPTFGATVAGELRIVGDSAAAAPLDAAGRARWVEALRGLAAACGAAKEKI